MAKVTVTKTPIPQPIHEVKVTLELSAEEATTLALVCGTCAGSTKTSLRRYTDHILTELENAGVKFPAESSRLYSRSTYFEENSDKHESFLNQVKRLRS